MSGRSIFAAALLCAGCATQQSDGSWSAHRVLVDTGAPTYSERQYIIDSEECSRFTAQRPVGDAAVGGLVTGALLGALVGAAYHDTGYGATAGAALGTASGAAQGVATQQKIVRECMRGRGYRVLD